MVVNPTESAVSNVGIDNKVESWYSGTGDLGVLPTHEASSCFSMGDAATRALSPTEWRSRWLWMNEKATQRSHHCLLKFKNKPPFSFLKSPHSNQGGHHPWSKLLTGHRKCQHRSQFHFPRWRRLCSSGWRSTLQGNFLSLFYFKNLISKSTGNFCWRHLAGLIIAWCFSLSCQRLHSF